MQLSSTRRRRGAATVEFAVTLLPLMLIIIGIIECGRLMMAEELMANAAREGARLAVLGGATEGSNTSTGATEVNYRVRQYLSGAQITATPTITITATDPRTPTPTVPRTITDLPQASAGDLIQVSVTLPFSAISWNPPWFFGGMTLKGSSVMRKEAP